MIVHVFLELTNLTIGDCIILDPALGRRLQPNSAGGSQTLDRYVGMSLGQPGVAEEWFHQGCWP
jgi:hypothetical protein